MATKKSKGFTLEVDGEPFGTFESIKPLGKSDWPKKCTEFTRITPSAPGKLAELWGPSIMSQSSGKSIMGLTALGKLLQPGHMYIRAQLEMWGVDKTKEVCEDCLAEIVVTLEDMGYRVWFDQKSSIKEEFAEACGVVVSDYRMTYVGRGDKGDE